MKETTLIKRKGEMYHGPLPNCHDGAGVLDFRVVLEGKDLPGKGLGFVHDDVLEPGVSIGVHPHHDDEEYYYILSGEGVMTLDGERHSVHAGDITGVFPGGSHGLENCGNEPMRILVISVRRAT